MLPKIKKVPLQKEIFPQSWQTVIFRNYGLVSLDKIAKTLGCSEETVVKEAERMGLSDVEYDGRWEKKGFITLIRNNWYLLNYEQLKTLLGYDNERLEFVLEKEDFLYVKLGEMKPQCETVFYQPLTDVEIEKTQALAAQIRPRLSSKSRAFAFFEEGISQAEEITERNGQGIRLVHGYLTPCGDAFLEDGKEYLPDSLLKEYQRQGVNGVWMHGVLSSLSKYPFLSRLSEQYPLRRKNLKELVERCARYGIKVYLYVNEPRGIPEDKIGRYADIIGTRNKGIAHMCMQQPTVREYLYTAVKDLFEEIPDLGGLITITMSENATHCNCFGEKVCNCPVCKDIPAEQSAVDVNNLIQKAVKDSGSNAKVLAYLWGWSPFMGWTEEQTRQGVKGLDKEIVTVCPSEYGCKFTTGGIQGEIIDYSISRVGPSEITKICFEEGQKKGNGACAKIQMNNSWECSAVPYMPVYDLVFEHLQNLDAIDVHSYMLTWTLGGYPSPMLGMIADYAENPKGFSLARWYEKTYGRESGKISEAVKLFCTAFKEYPFSIASLYNSPKTLGVANLWSLEAQENISTMVCYAFDDYETWIEPYPYETYISQYEKLLTLWEKGLELLRETEETPKIKELTAYAEGAYIHFKADYLHTQFAYYKRDLRANKTQILELLKAEKEITERLLTLSKEYPTIGFEVSNHYFYNERNLIEKIIQTDLLQEELV